MRRPRLVGSLLLASALLALSSCIVLPLPAAPDNKTYDSLPGEPVGVAAADVEAHYGTPHVTCDNDHLWLYGWTIGHGAILGMIGGLGGGMARLYDTNHLAILRFDAERRLTRVEVLELKDRQPVPPPRTSDGTVIQPKWKERSLKGPQPWACSPGCTEWTLAFASVVSPDGTALACIRPHVGLDRPAESPADYVP
jgi:hypothetical protein